MTFVVAIISFLCGMLVGGVKLCLECSLVFLRTRQKVGDNAALEVKDHPF